MKLKLSLLVLAIGAAACGGAVAEIAPTTTVEPTTTQGSAASSASSTSMDPMDDMEPMDDMDPMDDMGAMHMGDANALAASDVPGADLVSGDFRTLASAPDGFAELRGQAHMARHDAGTTVTIEFDNLLPGVEYIAHVHAGTCFDNGGPHYMFDLSGVDMPPNEIHLAFVSDSEGGGFMTAENHQVAGPEATSLVVHERSSGAPKIACADLS